MAAMLIPALMGLPGLIAGIMSAVDSGKRLSGGKLARARRLSKHPIYGKHIRNALKTYNAMHGGSMMRYRPRGGRVYRKRRYNRGRGIAADVAGSVPLMGPLIRPLIRSMGGRVYRRRYKRGRGVAADIAGAIPLLGGIFGPLVKAMGGRVRRPRRGRGLPNMELYQPIACGRGLLGPGSYRPHLYGRGITGRRGGLLSPTGMGGAIHRKGHYRYSNGRRTYVRPTLVRMY